ncbi:MAG TPA: ComEC/Rec2 family competence protein, partial [Planctomycetota bacterium]|nr:ComEC/Rec2 family competence protein [Planctomycetota bacterium]
MNPPPEPPDEHPRIPLGRQIAFHPLVLPACAFLVGILAHRYFPGWTFTLVFAAVVLALAVPALFFLARRTWPLHVIVILLCCVSGYLRGAYHGDLVAPDDVSRLADGGGALLRVRGCVSTRPRLTVQPADGVFQPRDFIRTRFHLEVDSVETRFGWERASGTVQVNVYDRADDFGYGDRIELMSRFSRPPGPSSPGEFDYRERLQREGIRLRTSLDTREALGAVIEHHRGSLLLELAHGIGARLARVIDRYHAPRDAGLLRCILLGERDAVDAETERTFRLSGLSHLLTVSGLHVVVLMGGLWLLLRFLLVPERATAAVVIVASLLYAALAGFQPSVVRAVVVTVIAAFGLYVGRRHVMLNSLAAAALVLLVRNPDEVFFAGFQLSFVSVLGLVTLGPGLYRFLRPRIGFRRLDVLPGAHHRARTAFNHFFIGTFVITASAWLASQPLVAYHFHVLNPITLGVNLLLMPLFGVILLVAFFVMLVETVFGGFLIASVSNGLVKLLVELSSNASRLPGAWVNFPSPPVWVLCIYYGLLVLAAAGGVLGVRRRYPAALALAVFCALVVSELRPSRPDAAELVILDVGQGSASLVRSPEGHAVLVDVGTTGSKDISRWIVLPYLIHERVKVLDAVILTHADTDHISGLPRLLDNFGVRKVLLGEDFRHSLAGARVERYLVGRGVPIGYVARGDRLRFGSVTLDVIHPPSSRDIKTSADQGSPRERALLSGWTPNERSLVVRGVTPHGTFLLTGDVSGAGFRELARDRGSLAADVLLAAHHGGFSGLEYLATELRWPVVLFSAEETFVTPEKLAAYRRGDARTFATWQRGTI